MSYFVLIYDRDNRELSELRQFADDDRSSAEAFRLQTQRESLDRHADCEIVLFEAASEEALRRTHGSYFRSSEQLLTDLKELAESA